MVDRIERLRRDKNRTVRLQREIITYGDKRTKSWVFGPSLWAAFILSFSGSAADVK